MLDVGTSEGVSVERLDVEDDGNDIKVEPEASAEIRALMKAVSTRGGDRKMKG